MKYWLLGLGAVLSTACGGSSDAPSGGLTESTAQSLVGIYEITTKTANLAGCDATGASTLTSSKDRFFFVEQSEVFGQRYVMIASCLEVRSCILKREALLNKSSYSSEFSYILTEASNTTTFGGFNASTGRGDDGDQCVERTYADHAVTLASDHALHLESRIKKLANRPQEDGFCTVEPAESKAEAASAVCASLETLDGRFVQGF